jgi:hypothetical protein
VKADTKIADRITSYPITYRVNAANEERLHATLSALLTTINTEWRNEAMSRDILDPESAEPATHKARTTVEPSFPSSLPNHEVLPEWYRDSRRETDRLRRIERRRKDRERDFERALERWEKREIPRFLQEMDDSVQRTKVDLETKRRLIDQDGVDGYKVRSDFNYSDRKRELDYDERDRSAEQKELEEKRIADEKRLNDLRERMKNLASCNLRLKTAVISNPSAIFIDDGALESAPLVFKSVIHKLPKTLPEIEVYKINWPTILKSGDVVRKLRKWLPNKLAQTCGIDATDSRTISDYIMKTIELEHPSVTELTFKVSSHLLVDIQGLEDVCLRAYQLLIFSQILQS